MNTSNCTDKPALQHLFTNMPRLVPQAPDTNNPTNLGSFGTSGHRGSFLSNSFNERN